MPCAFVPLFLFGCSGESAAPSSGQVETSERTSTTPTTDGVVVGAFDPVMVPSCRVNGAVFDLSVDDGVVYFVGEFTSVTDAGGTQEARHGVAACSLDEGRILDLDLGPIDGLVRSVATHDSRILIGGSFSLPGSGDRKNFAAIDRTTGAVNDDWGPVSVVGGVHTISVSGDGSVYLGGGIKSIDGADRAGVARLTADGELDAEFAPVVSAGDSTNLVVTALTEAADGRVYVGGDFGSLNGEPAEGIGAVDHATGRVTANFHPALSDTNPKDGRVQIRTVIVDGDWVYLCGDWWTTEGRGDGDQQRNVGRFTRLGVADPSFEPWTDGGVRDCVISGDDLVIGGHFDTVSGQTALKTARVSLVDGSATPLVRADTPKGVQALEVSDGLLVLGGTFRKVNGEAHPGLAVAAIAAR